MAKKEIDSIGNCATDVIIGFAFQPSYVLLMITTDPTAPSITTSSQANLATFPVVDSPKKYVPWMVDELQNLEKSSLMFSRASSDRLLRRSSVVC